MKALAGCLMVALFGIAVCCCAGPGGSVEIADLTEPKAHLRKIQKIKLDPQPAIDATNAARIRRLIKNLADISNPDFGFAPTISGTAFAPIAGTEKPEAFIFTDHQLHRSEDFTELIRLGPVAIPFLLEALTNDVPTKLNIEHSSPIGAMWFANELYGNPANKSEEKALGPPKQDQLVSHGESITDYRVTVGDICFVAVGQIVGRHYLAVRYQMTGCFVINSPTHDTNIARQVRQIWSSENARQHLLDSLLLDFATEGVLVRKRFNYWSMGSELQCGAAMRLLYYFPVQTTNLVADRLHDLNVSARGTNSESSMAREVTNGLQTQDFIRAVAWCNEPSIQAELRDIFRRTGDPEILVESCTGFGPEERRLVQKRIEEFIDKLPETEEGPFGNGYNLLVTLGEKIGQEARPAFERYIRNGSLQRRRSLCRVLEKTCAEWSVELLGPLLDDRRPAERWTYAVVPGQNEPRLPIRICDEAAETISKNFPKLKFKMSGEHKELDAQIDKMKRAIEEKKY